MDLILLDTKFNGVCVVDQYNSLIWTDRYDCCGDFEIYIKASDAVLSNLKQDYYLINPSSEHVMIIEKILIETTSEDGSYVTVSGRSLESILDRRIIWGLKTVSGSFQYVIEALLNDCIISPSDESRKIENFIFKPSDNPIFEELYVDAQYTGDNLYDVITNLCLEYGVGFKITINDNFQFVFELYDGVDRSYDQETNPYVVFSPNYDNLSNSNYMESKSSLKNITLVGGEGEGSSRKYTSVYTTDVVPSGLGRRELFTDARDISSDTDSGTLTTSAYTAKLAQRGEEKLAENKSVTSFEGEAEVNRMYKFGVDFFIGDIVQIANEYGHEAVSRIIEMVISEDENGFVVYPTFITLGGE